MDAVGDGTRRAILERLLERPAAVGELAAGLPVSRPAVSQHLRVLKLARLVTDRQVGTRRIHAVDPEGVPAAWERLASGSADELRDRLRRYTQLSDGDRERIARRRELLDNEDPLVADLLAAGQADKPVAAGPEKPQAADHPVPYAVRAAADWSWRVLVVLAPGARAGRRPALGRHCATVGRDPAEVALGVNVVVADDELALAEEVDRGNNIALVAPHCANIGDQPAAGDGHFHLAPDLA